MTQPSRHNPWAEEEIHFTGPAEDNHHTPPETTTTDEWDFDDRAATSRNHPEPAPTPAPAPAPRRREAPPQVAAATNRTWSDKLFGWLKGNKAAEGPLDEDIRALQRPLDGTINVAFINRKGGVGKTLATTLTGMYLADNRADRTIAIDASPEGGELCDRVQREQYGSVRSLLDQLNTVTRYSHVRTHTSQDETGLEILGSDPEAVGEPELTADDYRALMKVLRTYYPLILTDCAQGVNTPVMEAVLEEADLLVLVSEGADGMRSATWVASQLADQDGKYGGKYAHLVDDMLVVVTQRSATSNIDMDKVAAHFDTIARKVIKLPYDQALEGGLHFRLDEVEPSTRQAALEIATGITTSQAFRKGGR